MSHQHGDTGHATIDPFEPVVFDAERAAAGLTPWRGAGGPGERFYLDSEVERAPTVR